MREGQSDDGRRHRLQLVAAAASVAVWFVAEATGWKLIALAVLSLAWVTYVVRLAHAGSPWRDWGFRADNVSAAVRLHGMVAVVAVAGMGAYAWWRGDAALPPTLWLVAALYPAWALAQQFLLQNVVVRGLAAWGVPAAWLPLAAGVAFGAAHAPDWPLVALTGGAGVVWTVAYRRVPNLWVLAGAHALVGTLAFSWLLGRSAIAEFPALARVVGQ